MNRGILGVCVFVGLALIGVVALGGMAIGTAEATEDTQNASLGADISSFMQASSVETTDDVEDGTFAAALNRTEDPDERRALIEARQQRLQERSEQLRAQHGGLGNASDIRNRSMATRVSVGAVGLERSANRTETVAARNGVDTDQFDQIRSNARSLRGPEVADLARSIGGSPGGPPNETRRGPVNDELPESPGESADRNDERATDARDAERGSPAAESERPADVGGSPDTDSPRENESGDRADSATNGNAPSENSTSSNGSPSDGAPGQTDDHERPGSAGGSGDGPAADRQP